MSMYVSAVKNEVTVWHSSTMLNDPLTFSWPVIGGMYVTRQGKLLFLRFR